VLLYASAPHEAIGVDVANIGILHRQRQTIALAHRMDGRKTDDQGPTGEKKQKFRRQVAKTQSTTYANFHHGVTKMLAMGQLGDTEFTICKFVTKVYI
jgi:hypothetical protein